MRGLFVTFEGIDRSGKTTQAGMLCEALGSDALGVREPGGTDAGERVRALLKDPSVSLSPEAEALLFAAARSELVAEVILPALDDGKVVVSDRFLDSSLAYQGVARGLGLNEVNELSSWATGGLVPDLVFLLTVDSETGKARLSGERDRLELESDDFHDRVAAAYLELSAKFPDRFAVLDGARSASEVHADVVAEFEERSAGRVVAPGRSYQAAPGPVPR